MKSLCKQSYHGDRGCRPHVEESSHNSPWDSLGDPDRHRKQWSWCSTDCLMFLFVQDQLYLTKYILKKPFLLEIKWDDVIKLMSNHLIAAIETSGKNVYWHKHYSEMTYLFLKQGWEIFFPTCSTRYWACFRFPSMQALWSDVSPFSFLLFH